MVVLLEGKRFIPEMRQQKFAGSFEVKKIRDRILLLPLKKPDLSCRDETQKQSFSAFPPLQKINIPDFKGMYPLCAPILVPEDIVQQPGNQCGSEQRGLSGDRIPDLDRLVTCFKLSLSSRIRKTKIHELIKTLMEEHLAYFFYTLLLGINSGLHFPKRRNPGRNSIVPVEPSDFLDEISLSFDIDPKRWNLDLIDSSFFLLDSETEGRERLKDEVFINRYIQ